MTSRTILCLLSLAVAANCPSGCSVEAPDPILLEADCPFCGAKPCYMPDSGGEIICPTTCDDDLTEQPEDIQVPDEDLGELPTQPEVKEVVIDIPPDVPPLSVGVSVDSEILSGIATIGAVVEGGKAVMGVEFYVDNVRMDTDFIPPFNTSVNTSEFKDGFHLVSVFTADQYGQTASDSKQLTFDNTPPMILSTEPAEGDIVFFEDGPMHMKMEVDDPSSMKYVTFRANGLLVAEFVQPPFEADVNFGVLFIDINTLPKNIYVQFEAEDYLGQTTIQAIDVMVYKRHIWTFETVGEIWPTVSALPNGNIVFGNNNNKLFCLNQNGGQEWVVNTSGSITVKTGVNQSNSSSYYSGLDGNVYGVNSGGSNQWSMNMQSPPSGGLVHQNGQVYAASYSGTVYSLTEGGGGVNWQVALPGFISSSPEVAPDGTVYIGCQDNSMYAIQNGSIIWSIPTGGEVWSSPTFGADQRIYFGSNDGWVYSVKQDGGPWWVIEVQGQIWGKPLVASDGAIYVASTSKYVSRHDPQDGHIVWETKTEGLSYSSPAEGPNGQIYIGTTGGKVFCLDSETGLIQWTYTIGDTIHATPLIVGNKLFIGSTDRNMYSLWVGQPN